MPQCMWVWICDVCDGDHIYAATPHPGEIPEDQGGEVVGIYKLDHQAKLKIERKLTLI